MLTEATDSWCPKHYLLFVDLAHHETVIKNIVRVLWVPLPRPSFLIAQTLQRVWKTQSTEPLKPSSLSLGLADSWIYTVPPWNFSPVRCWRWKLGRHQALWGPRWTKFPEPFAEQDQHLRSFSSGLERNSFGEQLCWPRQLVIDVPNTICSFWLTQERQLASFLGFVCSEKTPSIWLHWKRPHPRETIIWCMCVSFPQHFPSNYEMRVWRKVFWKVKMGWACVFDFGDSRLFPENFDRFSLAGVLVN